MLGSKSVACSEQRACYLVEMGARRSLERTNKVRIAAGEMRASLGPTRSLLS